MKSCWAGLFLTYISESIFLIFLFPFLRLHASAPVGFAQLWSRGGWQRQELELPTVLPSCASQQPHGDRGMCRCPHTRAWPAVPGEMSNEKRAQRDSGVCCGSMERASLSCKLRLEIEAWQHSESGVSHSLLRSFFTSLLVYTQMKSWFQSTWKSAGCLEYGKRMKKKKLKL